MEQPESGPLRPPKIPKPESLEAKFKLLAMLPYDRRAKRKHCLVYGFILDWFHSKYGDALASVRHVAATVKERDPAGLGLYAGDVHSALTDLVAWGYLEQEKGSGRLASRYVPVWNRSVSISPNATDDVRSVLDSPNAGVLDSPNATADSVRISPNEDHPTVIRSTDPDTWKDEVDCPGPADGLSATAAVQGFEELYLTYAVKKNKADARRAYEKLAPDADLHARMVTAAGDWRHAAGGSIERMHLRRWIEEERYDEDPKGERNPREKKTKVAASVKPAAPNRNGKPIVEPFTERHETLTIISATDDDDPEGDSGDAERWLDLVFRRHEDGNEDMGDSFIVESSDPKRQELGQKQLQTFLGHLGLAEVKDPKELVGRTFIRSLRSKFGEYEYELVPANDNRSDAILTDDFTPAPREPRLPAGVSFANAVANAPWRGWASKIGTAYDDEDEDEEAA